MVSKIEIIPAALALLRLTTAFNYQSTIVNQRITHFENPHVGFDVRYFGDNGYPYLILQKDVTPYNDLHLILYTRVYDQAPTLLANAPISLCQLLHDETIEGDGALKQFNIPQILNLVGKRCPIEKGNIRLSPYIFPSNFTTDTDLGCGYMNVEARLMKCEEEDEDESGSQGSSSRKCETLVKTVTLAMLMNEECKGEGTTDDALPVTANASEEL